MYYYIINIININNNTNIINKYTHYNQLIDFYLFLAFITITSFSFMCPNQYLTHHLTTSTSFSCHFA